jgi:SWI/SNF-related matrix-associated actin-dependent regulator of chromatin subfamily A member 5
LTVGQTNFFINCSDWNKIIEKVEKGERKKIRLQEIKDIIQEKVERHLETVYHTMYPGLAKGNVPKEVLEQHSPWDLLMYSWSTMQFKYGHAPKGWTYRQEEDAFLLTMMHRHGYGAARRIQLEIRRAWQFRFDWFFKSRSPQEIQKRCDVLVKIVEKELEELHQKEEKELEAKEEMTGFSKPIEESNPFIDKLTERVQFVSQKQAEGDTFMAEESDCVKTTVESMEVEDAEKLSS